MAGAAIVIITNVYLLDLQLVPTQVTKFWKSILRSINVQFKKSTKGGKINFYKILASDKNHNTFFFFALAIYCMSNMIEYYDGYHTVPFISITIY